MAWKRIAPELWVEARRLYEQTMLPVEDIVRLCKMSEPSLYRRARKEDWRGRHAKGTLASHLTHALSAAAILANDPSLARAPLEPKPAPLTQAQRLALVEHIDGIVVENFDAIKRIVRVVNPKNQTQAVHGARAVASVSRSLRDMKWLIEPPPEVVPNDTVDDSIPRDLDEFRFELARRLRGIIEARRAELSEGSGGVPDDSERNEFEAFRSDFTIEAHGISARRKQPATASRGAAG